YLETNNEALSSIARSLLNERPYMYGEHYLPHDAEIRELMTAKSRKDTLESLGVRPVRVAPRQNVEDGINAVRNLLPRTVVDEETCGRGIEVLRNRLREADDMQTTVRERARTDWAPHGAIAFRYRAIALSPRAKPHPNNYPRRDDAEAVAENDTEPRPLRDQ